MKLKDKWPMRHPDKEYGIDAAVQITISRNAGDSGGIAEQARADSNACIVFIGALVEQLHASGALNDEQVIVLLSGGFEKAAT